MRRSLSALLIFILLFVFCGTSLALTPEDYDATEPEKLSADELYAASAILIDMTSGDTLLSKNDHARMDPASTTKIMTLLMGIESGIDLEQVVAIPQAAADVPKDSTLIPVYPGDQLKFGDLLTAFFLCSGNDGANAIAVLVSGSIESFVIQMNRRAMEIGCQGTHFVNAHGYTDPEHYTTAYDLALITRVAMQNDRFREIAAKTSATINVLNRGNLNVSNKHYIMRSDSNFYYSECIGVKTGSTNAAGKCYVGAARRNGAEVVSVVLKCEEEDQRWIDTRRLFEYAWTQYDQYTFAQVYSMAESDIAKVTISNAAGDDPFDGELSLSIAQVSYSDYIRMVQRNNGNAMSDVINEFRANSSIEITHPLTAPITEGEIMGNFAFRDPRTGNMVTALLVASRDVAERTALTVITDLFPFLKVFGNKVVPMILLLILILILLIALLVNIRRAAKHRRRRKILEQRRQEYIRRRSKTRDYSTHKEMKVRRERAPEQPKGEHVIDRNYVPRKYRRRDR